MTKQTAPPAIVRISTNTIIGNRFYNAYEPLPFASVEDMPANLKPLVVTGDPEAEEEGPDSPRGSFELNTLYQLTSDGRLGRKLQREAAQMEAEAREDEWLEEEVSRPLPEEIVRDLEDAHRSDIARQAAQAAADARRSDQASDAAAEAAEPPRLFVKRGSRHYAPVGSTRLKTAEPVFVRKPNGRFEYVGITDSNAELPDLPITL